MTYDIIIRHCGFGEYLALIVDTATGRELYRGNRHQSPEAALGAAVLVWETDGTANIAKFKLGAKGLPS